MHGKSHLSRVWNNNVKNHWVKKNDPGRAPFKPEGAKTGMTRPMKQSSPWGGGKLRIVKQKGY